MIDAIGLAINKLIEPAGISIRRTRHLRIPPMHYANIARLLYFRRQYDLIRGVDGDVVECGVGYGHSLLYLAALVREEMRGRKLWGFDSFEGFPEPSEADKSPRNPKKGDWGDTSIREVLDLLVDAGLDAHFVSTQVTLVKGYFEDSLAKYRGSQIALLHIDVDLYDSYRTVLEQLYPKLAPGGIVLFDEYLETMHHLHFPGAQKAIDEFLAGQKAQIRRDQISGKYFLVRKDA